jgi:hypothetical protein
VHRVRVIQALPQPVISVENPWEVLETGKKPKKHRKEKGKQAAGPPQQSACQILPNFSEPSSSNKIPEPPEDSDKHAQPSSPSSQSTGSSSPQEGGSPTFDSLDPGSSHWDSLDPGSSRWTARQRYRRRQVSLAMGTADWLELCRSVPPHLIPQPPSMFWPVHSRPWRKAYKEWRRTIHKTLADFKDQQFSHQLIPRVFSHQPYTPLNHFFPDLPQTSGRGISQAPVDAGLPLTGPGIPLRNVFHVQARNPIPTPPNSQGRSENRRFGRNPSRWIAQDYTVREKYICDIIRRFKVHPEIDVFSSRKTRRCVCWWGPGSREWQDAFQAPWTKGVLWMNPPYSRLPQVVEKCKKDGAHAILCVPHRPNQKWYQLASAMAVQKVVYPEGTRFFERNREVCRGTPWPVVAFLLCGHEPRCQAETMRPKEKKVRFGIRLAEPPPGTRGALGAEGIRTAHLAVARAIPMKSALTQPKLKPTALLQPEKKPKKMLDLFCGTGSVGEVYKKLGYQVISVDNDPRWKPSITTDVMRWDFKKAFQPGEFEVVVAGVPCTEYSRALTTRPRDLPKADAIVQRALEIIRYLDPPRWWIENPRNGLLPKRDFMAGIPYTDVDYCQYSDWGYQKPTRIWGSPHVRGFVPKTCDLKACPNLARDQRGRTKGHHKVRLSSPTQNLPPHLKYRIPEALVLELAEAGLPTNAPTSRSAKATENRPKNGQNQPRLTEVPSALLREVTGGSEDQLLLTVPARGPDGRLHPLKILVDTGAEVNLVRRDRLPQAYFQPSRRPLALATADGTPMEGGSQEAKLELVFQASAELPGGEKNLDSPCPFPRRGHPGRCPHRVPLATKKQTGRFSPSSGSGPGNHKHHPPAWGLFPAATNGGNKTDMGLAKNQLPRQGG